MYLYVCVCCFAAWCVCVVFRGRILDDLLPLILAWSNVPVRDSSVIAINMHACVFVQYMCVLMVQHANTHQEEESVCGARPSKAWHHHHRVEKAKREKRSVSLEMAERHVGSALRWITSMIQAAGPRLGRLFKAKPDRYFWNEADEGRDLVQILNALQFFHFRFQ